MEVERQYNITVPLMQKSQCLPFQWLLVEHRQLVNMQLKKQITLYLLVVKLHLMFLPFLICIGTFLLTNGRSAP